MVCTDCKDDMHGECPEGTWCDCQHYARKPVPYTASEAFNDLRKLALLMERRAATKLAGFPRI